MKNQYRQGDVFVSRIKALPASVTTVPRDNGRIVLAYGEVTGHAHAIAELDAELLMAEGQVYLRADGEVVLRHEEHGAITLSPGVYKVTRQREYTPEAIRNVAD